MRSDRAMRNDDHRRLAEIAAAQHGVIHAEQAASAGVSPRNLRYAERSGGLVRRHSRVWRMPGAPETISQAVWGAVLQVGGGPQGEAVASHESCFAVRGVSHVPFALAVTTGVRGNHHHEGIRVHRFGDLRPDMVERVGGLPVTTLARAVVDVTSTFRRSRLDQLMDRLTVTDRVLTLGSIDRALRRSNRRGRLNIRTLQELLDARDEQTPRSLSEQLADDLLATTDLPAPIREYPHPGWTLGDAFVDRAWPEALLIVEIDGRSWHARERDMQKDRARDRSAGLAGWFTARFIHREVRDEPDAFIADVDGLYRARLTQLGLAAGGAPRVLGRG